MFKMEIEDFDIRMLADSGQCFRMNQTGEDTYSVIAGDQYTEITQKEGEKEVYFSCSGKALENFWRSYFDLDYPYGKVKKQIDQKDEFLTAAVQYGAGIRILRQDLWEMIVSFLVSQNNNIKRIRNSIEAICRKYGRECTSELGIKYYAFPEPEELARATEEELHGLGLGYRDKYILAMALRCRGTGGRAWLESLKSASYEEAVGLLTKEYGIGKKVADCICLFGLHHVEAFPMDTHIKQILSKWYPGGFPYDRYEGFAGVIQQYMFYYKINA